MPRRERRSDAGASRPARPARVGGRPDARGRPRRRDRDHSVHLRTTVRQRLCPLSLRGARARGADRGLRERVLPPDRSRQGHEPADGRLCGRFMLVNPVGAFLADKKTPLYGKRDAFQASVIAPQRPDAPLPMKLMEGRYPEASNEALVAWGPGYEHANVGDTIYVQMISHSVSPDDIFSGGKPPPGAFEKPIPLTVTGIVLTPNDLNGTDSSVVTTYPFYEAHKNTEFGCDAAALHLKRGLADIPLFGDAVLQVQ